MCQLALGLAEELPRIDRRLVLGLLLLLFLSVQHGGKYDKNKDNDSGDGATVATAANLFTAVCVCTQLSATPMQSIAIAFSLVRSCSFGASVCLHRYNQATWKEVVGNRGQELVEKHVAEIVGFYLSQADAANHAVREAACACIAELGLKVWCEPSANKATDCTALFGARDSISALFSLTATCTSVHT